MIRYRIQRDFRIGDWITMNAEPCQVEPPTTLLLAPFRILAIDLTCQQQDDPTTIITHISATSSHYHHPSFSSSKQHHEKEALVGFVQQMNHDILTVVTWINIFYPCWKPVIASTVPYRLGRHLSRATSLVAFAEGQFLSLYLPYAGLFDLQIQHMASRGWMKRVMAQIYRDALLLHLYIPDSTKQLSPSSFLFSLHVDGLVVVARHKQVALCTHHQGQAQQPSPLKDLMQRRSQTNDINLKLNCNAIYGFSRSKDCPQPSPKLAPEIASEASMSSTAITTASLCKSTQNRTHMLYILSFERHFQYGI